MEFVEVRTAIKAYELTAAPGTQLHCAVYGEERVVVTVSQPVIALPPTLKVTVPGMEAVAVTVSTAP